MRFAGLSRGIRKTAFLAAMLSLFIAHASAESGFPGLRLLYSEEKVQSQRPGSEGWLQVDSSTAIGAEDKIRTMAASKAEFTIGETGIIRLGPSSIIAPSYDSIAINKAVFELGLGEFWVSCEPSGKGVGFRVSLKQGRADIEPHSLSDRSVIRITVGVDSTVEIKAYDGWFSVTLSGLAAEVDSINRQRTPGYGGIIERDSISFEGQTIFLQSGEKALITSSGIIVHIGPFATDDIDEQSSWVEWNLARDSKR